MGSTLEGLSGVEFSMVNSVWFPPTEVKQQLLEKEKMLSLEDWWDLFSMVCRVICSTMYILHWVQSHMV